MNYSFFKNYFDIHKSICYKKNPEYNIGKRIRNKIDYEGELGIFCIYLLEFYEDNINIKQYQYYYKRKFNKNIKLRYFIGFIEKIGDDNIYLFEYEDEGILSIIDRKNIKEISKKIMIEEFKKEFNENSINYINFFPNIFEDVGRKFIKQNGLEKFENSYK